VPSDAGVYPSHSKYRHPEIHAFFDIMISIISTSLRQKNAHNDLILSLSLVDQDLPKYFTLANILTVPQKSINIIIIGLVKRF